MTLSIITINYNNAIGLKDTIESVIIQDYKDYEFIIIDGGSTDESVDIIKKYKEQITYWISEPDNGIYNAMNKGVKHAKGEYCIFMNSGDCFYNKTSIMSIFNKNLKEDIITGETVDNKTQKKWFTRQNDISFLLFFRHTISHQSSFIKTKLLKEFPYNENLKIVSDWEFFIKTIIFYDCSFTFDDTIVAKLDLNGISITNEEQRIKERKEVLNNLFPQRVLDDYNKIKYIDPQLLSLINDISKTYQIRKIAIKLLSILNKLSKLFKKTLHF